MNVAESIDDVKLAARASGVGAPNDAAGGARGGAEGQEDRMAAIAEAEADEIACVTSARRVECTAAFNAVRPSLRDHDGEDGAVPQPAEALDPVLGGEEVNVREKHGRV